MFKDYKLSSITQTHNNIIYVDGVVSFVSGAETIFVSENEPSVSICMDIDLAGVFEDVLEIFISFSNDTACEYIHSSLKYL